MIEQYAAELVDVASNAANENGTYVIRLHHVMTALREDSELKDLYAMDGRVDALLLEHIKQVERARHTEGARYDDDDGSEGSHGDDGSGQSLPEGLWHAARAGDLAHVGSWLVDGGG